MKIKLAILEKDENYLNRITFTFGSKYADKLEVYSFTDMNKALATIAEKKVHVLLADERFEINQDSLPSNCGFAYLVTSSDIESLRNQKTVGKFQKADFIYKQVLSIFSEVSAQITGIHTEAGATKMIAVTSAAGGVGASTIAAAIATRLALLQKKVLYLDMELFGSSDFYFNSEGTMDFSNIIYALKGKNTKVALKIESAVKKNMTGVAFFSQCKNAIDMAELQSNDVERLLEAINTMEDYEYLVMDIDFSFGKICMQVMSCSDKVVFVSNGEKSANYKTNRALDSLKIIDEQRKEKLLPRIKIVHNCFKSQGAQVIDRNDVAILGGVPVIKNGEAEQIVQQIASAQMFDVLF